MISLEEETAATATATKQSVRATTRWARRVGLALMVCGALVLAWAGVVWQWQDPFTALYTMYKQHQLSQAYERRSHEFELSHPRPAHVQGKDVKTKKPNSAKAALAAEERTVRTEARDYRLASQEGAPLGKIIVPRLGLNMIFVNGTSESSLEQGPGRDLETFMPGESRLVYIAGHRTTFLAPFSHIDALRPGDRVTLELPYATFVYAVTRHLIVSADDLAVLRPGRHELLALQACHPRFFATHRYIVYARPIKVIPAAGGGRPYRPR
jgi:sortase A